MIPFEAIPQLGVNHIKDSRMAIFKRGGNYFTVAPKTYTLAKYACSIEYFNDLIDRMEKNELNR